MEAFKLSTEQQSRLVVQERAKLLCDPNAAWLTKNGNHIGKMSH
jgi:hypothetical protein